MRTIAASVLGLALLLAPSETVVAVVDPSRYVNPFIGTGGHGHTYPGATLPFGMVQLSPDTRLEGWDGCSGYHDTDRVVYGFSHTHLSGTGISDYGDILFMPVTGTPYLDNGYDTSPDEGYASRFDKATESAAPGWYAVRLKDYDVAVELTATERAGMHRYTYPAGRRGYVVVDLEHRDQVLESSLRVVSDREIEGFRRSTGWARDQVVYFVARFSRPFTGFILARDDAAQPDAREVGGENVKAVFAFGDGGGKLVVKVGISAVDAWGARENMDAEMAGWDFDQVRTRARTTWNQALSRVDVAGSDETARALFYAALYHSLLAPNLFSDVDGRYRGMDGAVHRAEGRRHYTVFSLWDTFRATHPLFTILEPVRTREFIETFLAHYREGGRLPVWELAGNETDTMIGYHAVSVIADAWVKGIRGFDARAALDAMVHSATQDHFGLEAYKRQGFIGAQDDSESVSRTLEYAYDDWCIARMAEGLGRRTEAEAFDRRSQAWRHVLDPETGFMRARRNQGWVEPFDPARVDQHYTEANAWQYSFFVPHDLEGLIEALGGDDAFVERLDALFEADSRTTGRQQADITGLIGQYAHGNEPSHHMAWLYHYAGRPARTVDRVRTILETQYTAAPDGLSGNEDCGQMSSWYVFAAMGLYPVSPCSDAYVIGSPIFDRVTLHLDGDRTFVIHADGADRNPYVQSARLGGRVLERSFLRHGEIVGGGELTLVLGANPHPRWGVAPPARPRSRVEGPRVLAAPFVRADAETFRRSLTVALESAEAGASIRYTLDPGVPPERWKRYDRPLELRDSTTVRFVAEAGEARSPAVEAYFHRIPHDWTIQVAREPAPEYSAGGPGALIDGRRAPENWRIGGWQGHRYGDFEATVDLGELRFLERAGAGFLQDVGSWIWMPAEVIVSVSEDGEAFRTVARLDAGVADDDHAVVIRDVIADLDGLEARYVRVRAVNHGTIPDWHPGAGDGAWIFVDEILVE